jgi:hypothetical protein
MQILVIKALKVAFTHNKSLYAAVPAVLGFVHVTITVKKILS